VGHDNVVNTSFTDLSRVLTELRQAVLSSNRLAEAENSIPFPISTAFRASCKSQSPIKESSRAFGEELKRPSPLLNLSSSLAKPGRSLGNW